MKKKLWYTLTTIRYIFKKKYFPLNYRWGRKRAMILSSTLVGVIGTMKAFSISYEMYVIVEFLETVAGASAFPAAYILSKFK